MINRSKQIIEAVQKNGIRQLIQTYHIEVVTIYDMYHEGIGSLKIYDEFRKEFELSKERIEYFSKGKTIWGLFESSVYPNIIGNAALERFKEKAPYYSLYVIGVCRDDKGEGDVCSCILELKGTEHILIKNDFYRLMEDLSFIGNYFLYSKEYSVAIFRTHSGTMKFAQK